MGLREKLKKTKGKMHLKLRKNDKKSITHKDISEPLAVISSNKEINEKYIFKGADVNKIYNLGKTSDILKPVDEKIIQKTVKIDGQSPKKETKGRTINNL